jgi:hypothetical protein
MWSPRDTPPPIEKIRKPQWTVENTRKTQAVVDSLATLREAARFLGQDGIVGVVDQAIERFRALDPSLKDTRVQHIGDVRR